MLLRLRRCAYQPRNIQSMMSRVTCSQICTNSSTPFNAKHNRNIPTSSSKRVEPSVEIVKENPIEVTFKFPDKQSVISQLLEYQKQNKHSDVLNVTDSLKKGEVVFIDNEVISLAVASAVALKLPMTIISLIDFASSTDINYNTELALTYIKASKDCPVESHPGMWSKAVGMLEIVLSVNGKTDIRELANRKLVEACLEETLLICANSGKWRNVLEIMEKTLANDCSPTERMLNAGGLCCAREQNGIAQAYCIFNYMIAEDIARTRKFYLALLQSHVRAKLFDKYEIIWAQLLKDNISRTDALCATRIDMLGALGEIKKAELVLEESLISIKKPKLSYNALYLALLRSGNTAKALDLVKKMRETGVQPPEQHTSSFHVQSLAKVGLVEEGLRFLRKQELDCEVGEAEVVKSTTTDDSVPSVSLQDEEEVGFVSEAAWQSLFRASLAHEEFSVAQELFDFALERQISRRATPPSSTAQVDTTLWVSQLFRSLGKAGGCTEAIRVAEK
jgi:pentatricopeptide repeat protein